MRRIAALSMIALAACATTNSTASTRPETMRVTSGSGTTTGTFTITPNTSANVTKMSFPLERVWRVMPAAYDSLGIPLTTVDPAKHLIGNEGMKIRQRLKAVALSQYLDCGQAQIGPSADSYEIFLTVTTIVQTVSATESQIATTVEAAGKPLTFAQEYSRCSSKGTLEAKLAAIVSGRLAGAK